MFMSQYIHAKYKGAATADSIANAAKAAAARYGSSISLPVNIDAVTYLRRAFTGYVNSLNGGNNEVQ